MNPFARKQSCGGFMQAFLRLQQKREVLSYRSQRILAWLAIVIFIEDLLKDVPLF